MPEVHVFLSHISEEKELAECLQRRISEDFLNLVKVFVSSDSTSIYAGERWFTRVESALRESGIFLALCSPASVGRSWINFEAGAAWMRNVPIVPICHSGLKPSDLGMPLSSVHSVELSQASGLERLYSTIAKGINGAIPKRNFTTLAKEFKRIESNHADPVQPVPAPGAVAGGHNAIQKAIDEARLGWTLCFIGEDQSDKLVMLTEDLRREFSDSGDGKRFDSGFSYWGIGPALAWDRACADRRYLVMKNSIESFPERWDRVKSPLAGAYHYVSLGIGNGKKDRKILLDLRRAKPDLYYFPVDMSPEMLRIGIKEVLGSEVIPRSKILPIQIDFSVMGNVKELRRVVTGFTGEEAILYSLLGNTIANFDSDVGLLQTLAVLLRPQDRLLLEVASTERIDGEATRLAGEEYDKSPGFKEFVLSALLQHTDLPAGLNALSFSSAPESDRAILTKVIYHNRQDHTVPMKLPDNTTIDFAARDTIRLLITRKYAPSGIGSLIQDAGFLKLTDYPGEKSRSGFGLDLVLLTKCGPAPDRLNGEARAK